MSELLLIVPLLGLAVVGYWLAVAVRGAFEGRRFQPPWKRSK